MPTDVQVYQLPGFSEPFSAISHLFGAGLFLFLGSMLMQRGRGSVPRMIYLGIYSFTSVFLLAMSGVYHMMDKDGSAHFVLARLDHGAIFLFIAGTFTPIHGLLFHGVMRWAPLLLIWVLAITGVTLKTVFFDTVPYWLGLSFYLGMGWIGVLSGVILARRFGFAYIRPLFLGGVAYSFGAIVDFWVAPVVIAGVINPHEVFHIFVLLAALIHWKFVWTIARYDSEASATDNRDGSVSDGQSVNR